MLVWGELRIFNLKRFWGEFRPTVNMLNAIEIIVESWNKITEITINNCFSHAFFYKKNNSTNEVSETSYEINTPSNITHCVGKNKILLVLSELSFSNVKTLPLL
ncbi:hypothetical protein CDIK_2782 [Cucumispora dikerogammari]|nr:hypothetical protein CDIK_2782 [Cucumispora dikerogammari]